MAPFALHAALAVAVLIAAAPSKVAAADDSLVYCLDRSRDLVTRRAAAACRS